MTEGAVIVAGAVAAGGVTGGVTGAGEAAGSPAGVTAGLGAETFSTGTFSTGTFGIGTFGTSAFVVAGAVADAVSGDAGVAAGAVAGAVAGNAAAGGVEVGLAAKAAGSAAGVTAGVIAGVIGGVIGSAAGLVSAAPETGALVVAGTPGVAAGAVAGALDGNTAAGGVEVGLAAGAVTGSFLIGMRCADGAVSGAAGIDDGVVTGPVVGAGAGLDGAGLDALVVSWAPRRAPTPVSRAAGTTAMRNARRAVVHELRVRETRRIGSPHGWSPGAYCRHLVPNDGRSRPPGVNMLLLLAARPASHIIYDLPHNSLQISYYLMASAMAISGTGSDSRETTVQRSPASSPSFPVGGQTKSIGTEAAGL